RFRKQGRYIGINLDNGYNQIKGDGMLASVTHYYDKNAFIFDSLVRNQQSAQTENAYNFSLNCTYTEPLSIGKIIDFSYNLNYSYNHSGQQTFNYNPVTNKYDTPDSLTTNNFQGGNHVQQLSAGYNYFKN